MTETALPNIWTLKEVTEYLKISEDIILKELETGYLHGFKIGQEWRFSDNDLLEYIDGKHSRNFGAEKQGLNTQETVIDSEFTEIGVFDFQWPKNVEHFDKGYTVIQSVDGRHIKFRIGFTDREAAGKMRRRIIVWMDERPLVEFAGSNDYEADGLLASVIKLPNNKQLTPYQNLPKEYKDFKVARYDSIIRGPFASRNMAIIVNKDDFKAMLRHAIIRATWKKLI